MPARKRKIEQCEKTREKIKAGMIVKKMQDHVNDPTKTPMTGTQIKASEVLLSKVMPSLSMADIQTTDVTENYGDLLQGLRDMANTQEDFEEGCKLFNIETNETNQELN